MDIQLIIDPSRVWSWQARLIQALRADGHSLALVFAEKDARRPLPSSYALLEALEAILVRAPPLINAQRIAIKDLPAAPTERAGACDLTLDVSGLSGTTASDTFSIAYNDADELSGMASICQGAAPIVSLKRGDALLMTARPAIEEPHSLSRGLDYVFARALTLGRAAPRLAAAGEIATASDRSVASSATQSFTMFGARHAARAILHRLEMKLRTAPQWRTGYRRIADDRVVDRGRWPTAAYTTLPDDGKRFYADPFVMLRDGVHHVFVEELPYATGKGVISHFTIDNDGRASAPRIVLEESHHFSYPMIFEQGDQIYMIPESSQARSIDLYRADPFPHRWVRERRLVEGVIASDMTLLRHNGKFWLLGTLAEEGGATSDGFSAFVADDLFGEWRAHPANPLFIDSTSARPAGMIAQTPHGLVRPAQDCSISYGGAMTLARIDRLDETGFSQTVLTHLPPDPSWKAVGAHTLNDHGGVEVIDWIA